MLSMPPKVRCRQIALSDLDEVAGLLVRGFPDRGQHYWERGLARLTRHSPPPGMPKYGFVLESCGRLEGVVLTIFSQRITGAGPVIRCNLSSWYVTPEFRGYAALLNSNATRLSDAVYVNISPANHTRSIIEAAGFSCYCKGQFVAVPALAPPPAKDDSNIVLIDARSDPATAFDPAHRDLLISHARLGCIALWCVTSRRAFPFIFLPRRIKGVLPCAQLIYSTGIEEFVRLARPLGCYLAARARPFVIVDANGPIMGLAGRYFPGKTRRYFKGVASPGLSDLAYTEAVMFGL